jgi:hypothetical protein
MRTVRRAGSLGLVVCSALAGALLSTDARAETVVVGQTPAFANEICAFTGVFFQTAVTSGPSYAVPVGNWMITSWSADGGNTGGQMSLNVLRATGAPGDYQIVAQSALETLSASERNSFTTNISVEGGDIIGIWATMNTACSAGIPSAADTFLSQPISIEPAVGTTLSGLSSGAYSRINISALLTPQLATPTPTPKPSSSNGGCELDPDGGHKSAWMLLVCFVLLTFFRLAPPYGFRIGLRVNERTTVLALISRGQIRQQTGRVGHHGY